MTLRKKPFENIVGKWEMLQTSPLSDIPILGSSNSAANKDNMDKMEMQLS